MNTKNGYLNSKHHIKTFLLALTLSVTLMFILQGCSVTEDVAEENIPAETIDHNIDANPVPLSESEMELTLEGYGAFGALADTDLSIADMLMYAVQDEYLAHAEYSAIIDQFGDQKPYTNIILAEETHLSLLQEVYLSYGMDFPTDSSESYVILPTDLLAAAQTGVQAEIDNIEMYQLFMSYDLPPNVYEVFSALKAGSDSHLLAFQKQVDRLQ
jgi:hypothetical protein